ncbi:pitrilysin family protein [Fulvivirgaceae bacterium BMA10]|uniref:Pitrilysin family protein n=1 Tax=Splendidivirga corallicola TaxID=3051826 RepID=A0ABT8KKI0_9BACT|nr:pitrilysin family protein [Fulvivirgaceae bacterium BMA10]
MRDYELITLPNGIRVVLKEVSSTKIVHCGFILDIGSRDEKPTQAGLAHFWEHMAFKGTNKRKAFHIINRLESVGGELNAYTSKEKICFYASVLNNYFENALELLTDITFDSIFPEKQIEKERGVILEEMSMYHDVPEDAIQDEFDNLIFTNHPLGNNILGTAESVKSFHRTDFQQFIKENLNTERLIFSVVGNVSLKQVKKLADRYLANVPHFDAKINRLKFNDFIPTKRIVERNLTQAQCAIGRTAYAIRDPKRLTFFMLTNILGGPGMNSKLNLALREKHGYVYSVEANYSPYIDTGLFSIFFGTDPKLVNKSIKVVLKEMQKLSEKPLGTMQLHKAKEQLMGQLAMSEENNASLMLMMGKSLLDLERIQSLEEIFAEIRNVTALNLQDVATEMFVENELSNLNFLPKN